MKTLFIRQYLYGDGNDPIKRDVWIFYDKTRFYILSVLKFEYDPPKVCGYKLKRNDYIHHQINILFYNIRDDPLTRKIKCEYEKMDWDMLCEQIEKNGMERNDIETNFFGFQVEPLTDEDIDTLKHAIEIQI